MCSLNSLYSRLTSKVAYYGLSSAGIICLWLLNCRSCQQEDVDASQVFRNLSVLVAEMESGILIQAEDPNYHLLAGASSTIKRLLDRLLFSGIEAQNSQPLSSASPPLPVMQDAGEWNAWDSHALQDFESDFWLNLAEHPFLLGADTS